MIGLADITHAQLGRPQKYAEGWSSKKKHFCILKQRFLRGESYELTQVKAFDIWWNSVVKGQSEILPHMLTMVLQQ